MTSWPSKHPIHLTQISFLCRSKFVSSWYALLLAWEDLVEKHLKYGFFLLQASLC
jgi:hypothetical protein